MILDGFTMEKGKHRPWLYVMNILILITFNCFPVKSCIIDGVTYKSFL